MVDFALFMWILAALFKKFQSLGRSTKTSHNWADPKNVPMGKICNAKLNLTAVKRAITQDSQVVGKCGDNVIFTQSAQIAVDDGSGKITSQKTVN